VTLPKPRGSPVFALKNCEVCRPPLALRLDLILLNDPQTSEAQGRLSPTFTIEPAISSLR
jgi:hypothetical protein